MRNVSPTAAADEYATVRTWTADEDQPVDEHLPQAEAESRFAEMRDHPDSWPSTFAAELRGADDEVLDSW